MAFKKLQGCKFKFLLSRRFGRKWEKPKPKVSRKLKWHPRYSYNQYTGKHIEEWVREDGFVSSVSYARYS